MAKNNRMEGVRQLAIDFRNEGMEQKEMYDLFTEVLKPLDGNDPQVDALMDTMDCIIGGPWAKGSDIYPTELKQEDQ